MCLALQIWSALSIHTCISPRSRCPRIPFWNKRSLTVLYCQSNGEGPLSLSLPLASPPVPLWSHHLQLCAVRAIKQSPFRSLILVVVSVCSFIFEVKNRLSWLLPAGPRKSTCLSLFNPPLFIGEITLAHTLPLAGPGLVLPKWVAAEIVKKEMSLWRRNGTMWYVIYHFSSFI